MGNVMTNTLDSLYSSKLFIPGFFKSTTLNFIGTDTLALYEQNLKTQPDNWPYKNKSISYSFNSNGYREKEWDECSWRNSIVLLGCSMTMGVGLPIDETISFRLSQITNRPVINLGLQGSSCWVSCLNSQILYKHYPNPYAVVQIWSDSSRLVEFTDTDIFHHGSWKPIPLYKHWNQHEVNTEMHIRLITSSDRIMWSKTKTKYLSFTLFEQTAIPADCLFLRTPGIEFNFARDCGHIGPLRTQAIASHIKDKLDGRL